MKMIITVLIQSVAFKLPLRDMTDLGLRLENIVSLKFGTVKSSLTSARLCD